MRSRIEVGYVDYTVYGRARSACGLAQGAEVNPPQAVLCLGVETD